MPGDSGVLVVTMLACFIYFARKAAGASCARYSPRPLFRGSRTKVQTSRKKACGEIAKVCLLPFEKESSSVAPANAGTQPQDVVAAKATPTLPHREAAAY